MVKLLVAFLVALATPSHMQSTPSSPCPDVFVYEKLAYISGADPDRWFGNIEFPKRTQRWLFLNVVLDKKADLFGTEAGEVTTLDNTDFRIDNGNLMKPGPIRFFVKYGLDKAPKLYVIRVDGQEICNADTPSPARVSATLPPLPYSTSYSTPSSAPLSATRGNGANSNEQCGVVKLNNPIPLVVEGTPTLEGQWPWQVALYQTKTVNHNYVCGGTLVGHKHVITAAHCTTVRGSDPVEKIDHNTLTVYLGKHHLIYSIQGAQFRFVEKVSVHSDYSTRTFNNDISILQLQQPVEYTDWVQPACLWPDSLKDLSHIVGKSGSVVGWGNDGSGLLHLVEMPVVSEVTCLRSKPEFYTKFTSDHTYCAGFRDGRSACNGDSGGGMVFQIGEFWHLRGLVSFAPSKNPHQPVCDPRQYVVFTDVAKLLPWVLQNMS